jgi:hypothetical protein
MKKYIIGAVVGATLMFSTQAFAAIGEKIEAIYAEFKLIVNGKEIVLDETPIVVNGNSYLPVRSLSNMLGYDVTYRADSRTIELRNGVVQPNTQTPTGAVSVPAQPNGQAKQFTVPEGEITEYSQISHIVDDKKHNFNYVESSNTVQFLMDDIEYNTYRKIKNHETQELFCLKTLSLMPRLYPQAFEGEKVSTFKIHFIFNGNEVLEFQDKGEGNKSQDLNMK